MVHVLVYEDEWESLDRWAYLLMAMDIPVENCHFPLAPEKFKWKAPEGTVPLQYPWYQFSPPDGKIPGEDSFIGEELPEDCVLVFGGDNRNLTEVPHKPERIFFLPNCRGTQMHGATAGAIALWEWRRCNGWRDN